MIQSIRKNLLVWSTLLALLAAFGLAISGMSTKDWVITLLRGLSVGSLTFLVAAGFSLIFGLLDVLNLAHGTLFMIGAYVGWTVYVRPDTFVDLLAPLALLGSGLALQPVWHYVRNRLGAAAQNLQGWHKILPWLVLLAGLACAWFGLSHYPISAWSLVDYNQSPATYAFQADQRILQLPPPAQFVDSAPWLVLSALLLAGALLSLGLSLSSANPTYSLSASRKALIAAGALAASGLILMVVNDALTAALLGLGETGLFVLALLVATLSGMGLGALMESTLIRPLYSRPIYQLMLTLGLSAIGIEMVRSVWGRPEFTMPKPMLFSGTGEGCPAESLSGWLANHCSTIFVFGGRVRVYNEILIPIVGLIVLLAVWLLLQRSRLGMVIRAGVQDRQMVEALGINVRKVFTQVFALGVGLAALGGALAAPSMGLSNGMGENLLLNALIALAIGGLTSYPGAALGSVLVGLMQQFIIKYGQIGIQLPFLAEPFKPTPPLVPASTVLLMVIILLVLPQGLFGRKE